MKRNGPGHRKVRNLCAVLGVPAYGGVGILELLWHQTSQYTPDGGIGRFTDEEIAAAVGWPIEKAVELVEGLVRTRLVDRSKGCRLVVHDWDEHCDSTCDRYLARKGLRYANGSLPRCQRNGNEPPMASGDGSELPVIPGNGSELPVIPGNGSELRVIPGRYEPASASASASACASASVPEGREREGEGEVPWQEVLFKTLVGTGKTPKHLTEEDVLGELVRGGFVLEMRTNEALWRIVKELRLWNGVPTSFAAWLRAQGKRIADEWYGQKKDGAAAAVEEGGRGSGRKLVTRTKAERLSAGEEV